MPVCQLLGQSSLQTHLCCKDTSLLQIENARSKYTNTQIQCQLLGQSPLQTHLCCKDTSLRLHLITSTL